MLKSANYFGVTQKFIFYDVHLSTFILNLIYFLKENSSYLLWGGLSAAPKGIKGWSDNGSNEKK